MWHRWSADEIEELHGLARLSRRERWGALKAFAARYELSYGSVRALASRLRRGLVAWPPRHRAPRAQPRVETFAQRMTRIYREHLSVGASHG